MDISTIDISGLTVAERLDLIARLWDSIKEECGPPPNAMEPDQLMAELERRLENHRRAPSATVPWEDVLADLDREIDRRRK